MDFSLLDPNSNTVLRFPVAPSEMQVRIGPSTYSFSPVNLGNIELPKGRQPVQISLSGIFPGLGRSLPGARRANPNNVVTRLKKWSDSAYNRPLRFIVTGTPWNLLVFISQFEAMHQGGHGDVTYTLDLTEWRQLVVQEVRTAQQAQKRADTKAKPQTYTVKSGDSLWKIAQRFYGNGTQWRKIYEANKSKIKNPDLIYPGQKFVIPP